MAAAHTPYRPPAAAPLVRWPDRFGQRFTITVDTEEEFDWTQPLSRAARSITATAALPAAARRMADLGASAIYLVDHPVATDPAAIDRLRAVLADGRSAVGTQLHPWVNPPFDEEVTPRTSFAGNLPITLEAAKLDALTGAITAAFGAPRIYRAGRYGIGPNTTALLAKRGYRLDSSVRARYDYRADDGPDFRTAGNDAFHIGHGIVELPLTSVFIGAAAALGPRLYPLAAKVPHLRGALARSGLLSRIALSPEDMPLREASDAVRRTVGEGTCLLTLSYHSPSLVPGHTPYVRDAADLATFWAWWDGMLGLLARLGVRDAPLDALLAATEAPLA